MMRRIIIGLIAKNNTELNGIAIAAAAKKFVSAKAIIDSDEVIVWNDDTEIPVGVRYA